MSSKNGYPEQNGIWRADEIVAVSIDCILSMARNCGFNCVIERSELNPDIAKCTFTRKFETSNCVLRKTFPLSQMTDYTYARLENTLRDAVDRYKPHTDSGAICYLYSDENYISDDWKIGVPRITKVIFNNPATIVLWADGTKTVVKAQNESFDPEKGLAMAIAKKAMGNAGCYYNEFKKWIGDGNGLVIVNGVAQAIEE